MITEVMKISEPPYTNRGVTRQKEDLTALIDWCQITVKGVDVFIIIEAVEMKPGDCINIPAGVKHWHGAAPDSWFSHLAIEVPGENCSNEWLEAVCDDEYGKLE